MANREQLFKILIVGDCGTGKTCLIRQYMHNSFQATNKATIGVDFALKVIPQTNTTLQIWDIAGQERYGQMTRVYFLSAVGAMVVCEINKPASFETAVKWKEDLDSKVFLPGTTNTPIPCILLLNKSDLGPCHMSDSELSDFCAKHKFVDFFKVSAKSGENVEASFDTLVNRVNEHRARAKEKQEEGRRPDQNASTLNLAQGRKAKEEPKKKGCPCSS